MTLETVNYAPEIADKIRHIFESRGRVMSANNLLQANIPVGAAPIAQMIATEKPTHAAAVPIYTSSPGDSSIGMNIAALALEGNKCVIDPNADVNETASIVLGAKRGGGKSAIMICGGGSPKNFALQTEPQIQEVLGIDEKGHDFFLQITDARPDTGGLSGATPSEAVSWGKVDPDNDSYRRPLERSRPDGEHRWRLLRARVRPALIPA